MIIFAQPFDRKFKIISVIPLIGNEFENKLAELMETVQSSHRLHPFS
jgi:hypothetical protein